MPKGNTPLTFVFSGRLSPTKNIDSLIWCTYYLQKQFKVPVGLVLCGDFDNERPADRGGELDFDYSQKIQDLSNSLDWNIQPRFLPKTDTDSWIDSNLKNPVFTSLSTFICEDFGVALAQAQRAGWPCLISDWGGHQEVRGSAVIKVHPAWIGNSCEPDALIQLKSRALAARVYSLLSGKEVSRFLETGTEELVTNLAPLPCAELDRIRRATVSRLGTIHRLIYREGLDRFSDTEKGKLFFSKYRLLFSGSSHLSPVVIATHDFSPSVEARKIEGYCNLILEKELQAGNDVIFLPLSELLKPQSFELLLKAGKFIFPFYSRHLYSLILWVKSAFQGASVSDCISGRGGSDRNDEIKVLLRKGDIDSWNMMRKFLRYFCQKRAVFRAKLPLGP